ncbi:hydrolase, hydrolyzing O-glycosyl compounds, putative [Ricinus communis]|uniref:Hydrolase, hydrolyzing O-glycosyl compounds, putative n=1 Tax=Ricinus communis TaxID=3988 RepID=B9S134_RICCO|nr:hydrolase, hydrolyzing O-glycosyl compounds, putative [Ricinus communis]
MGKSALSLPLLILGLLFILLPSINSGTPRGIVKLPNAEKTWCVAKPSSSEAELVANINFACDQLNDCKLIQPNGTCYYPSNYINHASVVMNLYYQSKGRNTWNCDFKNSGLISKKDPSYGCCSYL